jgi:hypothetical protein
MKTILVLLTLSSLMSSLMPQAAWSNSRISETRKQLLAQIDRPSPNGGCWNHRGVWIENCFQGVQWEQVPNSRTFVGGYDKGYSWVGINTISRNGGAINFDLIGQSMYTRFSANCNTRVYAIILASDSFVDPNAYSPVNEYVGQALDFACSISQLGSGKFSVV